MGRKEAHTGTYVLPPAEIKARGGVAPGSCARCWKQHCESDARMTLPVMLLDKSGNERHLPLGSIFRYCNVNEQLGLRSALRIR